MCYKAVIKKISIEFHPLHSVAVLRSTEQSNCLYALYHLLTSDIRTAVIRWWPPAVFKKKKVKFSLSTARRRIEGAQVWLHSFLTLVLDGGEQLTSCPSHLTPKERSPVHTKEEVGWAHSRSECVAEENHFLSVLAFKPPTDQPITSLLDWLPSPSSLYHTIADILQRLKKIHYPLGTQTRSRINKW